MARVYDEAARAAWAHFLPAGPLARLRSGPERFERAIAEDAGLVAELDGEIVSFAVTRPSQDDDADPNRIGELAAFYSLPSVWGTGVGRSLLDAATEALRERGFEEATLWTAEQNERPRRIYERAGWQLDGGRRTGTWLGVTIDELRHRRRL